MIVNSIELFCGTGGLAIGLQLAGFSHAALYEWDKDSCDNVKYNIDNGYAPAKNWKVYQADVRDVDYSQYANNVHLVSGGPPCQPFSLGGKGQAYNDKRDMFPEAVRAVREIKPEVFIFENVKGLLRDSFAEYFEYIILQLTYPEIVKKPDARWTDHYKELKAVKDNSSNVGLQYNVEYKLMDAADYGVPQSRHRVFIVGFRSDLKKKWKYPKPTHSREKLLYDQWITGTYWSEFKMGKPEKCPLNQGQLQRIRYLVENGKVISQRWRTVRDAIGDLPDPTAPTASSFFDHDFRPGAKSYAGHSGSNMDNPSKTIKAGSHGVPGGENMVELDNGSIRYYTVRESARIQTFPDSYRFSASWTESMRQIGNAVPVRLATIVGESVLQQLKGD